MCKGIGILLTVSWLLYSSHVIAGTTEKEFLLPKHGALKLNVPDSWVDQVSYPPGDLPPTIRFIQKAGERFDVYLTPIWKQPGAQPGFGTAQGIKKQVQSAAHDVASQSVEKNIIINELSGSNTGYYFSVTDKAPKPGEYKLMTQGVVRLDDLLVTFTALTDGNSDSVVSKTIEILKTAEHKNVVTGANVGAKNPVRPDAVQIIQNEAGYVVTVPVSRLVMNIPGKGFTQKGNHAGDSTNNPRYFYFDDAGNHVIVSGWFEPAQGYKGVRAFWDDETASWKKNGLPEPHNVTISKAGSWDVIAYNVSTPGGALEHIRAHLVQSGTWIDIHISQTTSDAGKGARERLSGLLDSIKVLEK